MNVRNSDKHAEAQGRRQRASLLRTILYWTIPPVVCLILYWRGFRAWFRADDFAWLSSGLDIRSFRDLLEVLFAPAAQGTIRPWSEPGFFLTFYKLFGLNPLPFRLVIFATHFANLALVAAIGTRLTGMRAAGFCAALFWTINASLVEPLGWACTYNQVMCGFFLLLAFYFLLRHIETGARRYYFYQWIAFLAGFGALETMLVYPMIAGGYTFFCARKYLRRTLPMGALSALYVAVHVAVAPTSGAGPYAMHFDGSMLRTLATYWTWSLGTPFLDFPFAVPKWVLLFGIVLLTAGLLAFPAVNRTSSFFVLWFVAIIAPVLPLGDHMTEYYIYLPVIGLCWLGGWAFASACRSGWKISAAAIGLALIYCGMSVPEAIAGAKANYQLTMRARRLVEGVARAHQLYADKAILLAGVDTDLFQNAVLHQPFRLVGADHVYLAPGSARTIAGDAAAFELPAESTQMALSHGDLVVYDARGPRLRNITSLYSAMPQELKPPSIVDAASPLNSWLLGPEWYAIDEDHRWMPKRAALRIAGPERPGQQLHLRGGTVSDLLQTGPVTLRVTVDGAALPSATINSKQFDLSFPLPSSVVGKPEMSVTLEVSRAFRSRSDPRELSLQFGVFEVR